MIDVVLQLFTETERRFWKNKPIPVIVQSKLFRKLLLILWNSRYCNEIEILKSYYHSISEYFIRAS